MKEKKCYKTEPCYYSKRLKCKLNELRFTFSTIVEAPSGYGKTTAIKNFFEAEILQNTPVYWFTAMDETPAASFGRLCLEINKIDSYAGGRLLKTGLPNAATIGEACDALRTMQCNHETYLVIDNFQFLCNMLIPSFFTALVEHGGKDLHIVIITQMLEWDMHAAVASHGFLHITASDLRLDARDIRRYYALADVNITLEDAQNIERHTKGWIIAVYLQLCAFRGTGTFSDITILPLMEHLVWDKLTQEQQTFLLLLSPLEKFTVQQACIIIGCEVLPTYAQKALKNPFIQYDIVKKKYEIHSILSKLLKQKREERGATFERKCLLKSANLYQHEGRTAEAIRLYWQIKDYEHILSLDFSHLLLKEIDKTPFSALALDIVQNCPADIKKTYPLSMLRIAWALLMFGFHAEFNALMEELQITLEEENRENIHLLLGEWMLLSSFNSYPYLDKMNAILQKAASFFEGKCSQVILPSNPWYFGSCVPLLNFHIIPGKADQEADALEKYVMLYSKLTNGHGSGADVLYQAVLAYHRGNISEAETLAFKSIYIAESKQQSIVQLGAALQLAQVALHKADTMGWQHAIDSMERVVSFPLQDPFVVRSALDIMKGMLLVELQQLTDIADWLKNGDFSERRLLPEMLPLALFVHTLYLLHQGKSAQLIGIIEAGFLVGLKESPVTKMLMMLNLAAGYIQTGNREKAAEIVRRAAQTALPDGMIFTFASFSWLLQGLTDEIVALEYPELYNKLKEIKKRFSSGWTKLYNDMLPEKLPSNLTKREHEVALLATDGLHNSEIAKKLFISESTVRTHMRSIFKKLDIDRRIKLAEKLK